MTRLDRLASVDDVLSTLKLLLCRSPSGIPRRFATVTLKAPGLSNSSRQYAKEGTECRVSQHDT